MGAVAAVKPSNIMLTKGDGRFICKLIDLSISAVEEAAREDVSNTMRTGTTSLGAQMGTPHCESRGPRPWYPHAFLSESPACLRTQTCLLSSIGLALW